MGEGGGRGWDVGGVMWVKCVGGDVGNNQNVLLPNWDNCCIGFIAWIVIMDGQDLALETTISIHCNEMFDLVAVGGVACGDRDVEITRGIGQCG